MLFHKVSILIQHGLSLSFKCFCRAYALGMHTKPRNIKFILFQCILNAIWGVCLGCKCLLANKGTWGHAESATHDSSYVLGRFNVPAMLYRDISVICYLQDIRQGFVDTNDSHHIKLVICFPFH
jgi:hypothetical protein